ncbi:MAG: hypothetical protein MJ157_04585 [Clostridia bacterium]|nr:hypothetical protein [Clostridia bacterium]
MDCYNYDYPQDLLEKMNDWKGQTITVYLPGLELTGTLIGLGKDYLALQLADNQRREVYIPLSALLLAVAGEALTNTESTAINTEQTIL